jgi:FtsP/CotA-like multicopper oxidase with cupredoxin domain
MDHPFHLHGFRFEVTDVDGARPPFRALQDTINIGAMQTVTLRVPLDGHPGAWMFHCHILEHAERGMMGELDVIRP